MGSLQRDRGPGLQHTHTCKHAYLPEVKDQMIKSKESIKFKNLQSKNQISNLKIKSQCQESNIKNQN